MEDDLTISCKWKTTSTKFVNGRRPQQNLKMEDDLQLIVNGRQPEKVVNGRQPQKICWWKTTSNKFLMEDYVNKKC
jgi:hypothetical protein